jgi:hypothetical protein
MGATSGNVTHTNFNSMGKMVGLQTQQTEAQLASEA